MSEQRIKATPASPGLAMGPIVFWQTSHQTANQTQGSPDEERAALLKALDEALTDLRSIATDADELASDILEFQIAIAEDPELTDEAFELICGGTSALDAWRQKLAEQRLVFEGDDDEYFQARASDLRDLEENVAGRLAGMSFEIPLIVPGSVLLKADLTPSEFLRLPVESLAGIVLHSGSASSHVAILARARGIAMLVETGAFDAAQGQERAALLDAEKGELILAPSKSALEEFRLRIERNRQRADDLLVHRHQELKDQNGEPISVMINLDAVDAVPSDLWRAVDGVGLFRTEFLLMEGQGIPDEEAQRQAYSNAARRLQGKPLIIRTFDIGGDKPLPSLGIEAEANAFLGLRGIRLCLERRDFFIPQLRALLRTACDHNIKIMLPMISTNAEILEVKALIAEIATALERESLAYALPPLGIMVETPASALTLDQLDTDFCSIGSNDLIQYVMAASRDSAGRVAALADPMHPAILRLVGGVIREARQRQIEVSLCGDMASQPAVIPALLDLGLRSFSVAPAAFDRVKAEIATHLGC